jgi:hypothetical protein
VSLSLAALGENNHYKSAVLVLVDMLQNLISQIEQNRIEIPGDCAFFLVSARRHKRLRACSDFVCLEHFRSNLHSEEHACTYTFS